MAYLASSTYEDIRNDPSRIVYYYNQTKETFQRDLGLPVLSEGLLEAAFCSVVAYGMAPYGAYKQPSVTLNDLLKSPTQHCGTYMYLTWGLLEEFGAPVIDTITLGWDSGALGNHSQILVNEGDQSLLLDPTIALVVYGVTFDGLISGDHYSNYKSFFSRDDIVSFNSRVIGALEEGLCLPKDLIYKYNTLDELHNHFMEVQYRGVDFFDRDGKHVHVGGSYSDNINLGGLSDICYGGKGDDTISSGGGSDNVYGGIGNDTLFGQLGNDFLYGESGNDRLYGGLGNDSLDGGDGKDWLVGNAGADVLTGGSGPDVFRYQSISDTGLISSKADLITDFSHQQSDRIDLNAIDANVNIAGNQAFNFVGAGSFTGAGQVRYFYVGEETKIIANIDSNPSTYEFLMRLAGHYHLENNDFVL